VLCAAVALERLGLPDDVLAELAGITCRASAMQHGVLDLFSGQQSPGTPRSCAASSSTRRVGRRSSLGHRIVDYVHQRTLQRLTLNAIGARRKARLTQ
jgi:hypothetical protein